MGFGKPLQLHYNAHRWATRNDCLGVRASLYFRRLGTTEPCEYYTETLYRYGGNINLLRITRRGVRVYEILFNVLLIDLQS